MARKPKVAIALNTAWNLVNFRAGLIRALGDAGYEVIAVAPPDEYAPRLAELCCRFVPLPMDNKGTHPGRDLLLFWRFYWLLRKERPGVFLGYTIKPNIYGSLAAHLLGIPVINNIAGLGAVFVKESWLTRLVRALYRLALSRSAKVFFQNEDDRRLFIEGGLVGEEITDRLPGSGIDLAKFTPVPLPASESPNHFLSRGERNDEHPRDLPSPSHHPFLPKTGERGKTDKPGCPVRFLLIARMLWDKGVGEFVEAARILERRGIEAECCLLGFLDVQNPAAISRQRMDEWVAEGVVRYLGTSDDVRTEIAMSDCVVLPSYYREGVPRTLLEAAAMARPLITTDAVGCREVVDDGVNGYLCRPRDAEDLAEKMERMASLSPQERQWMGLKGREKMEREFDERIVIRRYMHTISSILRNR